MSKVDKNYQLKKAGFSDFPVIQNLAMFYRYDLSEYTHWSCDSRGMFRCEGLEFYLKDDNLSYVIYAEDELLGFVLIEVNKKDNTFEIAEFFILRKFRGQGIATAVAMELMECFKGQWEIRQLAVNKPAIRFWKKVLKEKSDDDFTLEYENDKEFGELCVMRFVNKGHL